MKKNYIYPLLLAMFVPGAVQAQDNGAMAVMEEVVVTATKTEEKRKDISNTVILVDKNDIAESPADSVGELLANEPGIDWRTRGNYGAAAQEIHIRGMDAKGTQVMVNGMVVNSSSLGVADVGRISMNNIERLEVVKGPGSLLYGSGAMAGTVNIITKRPKPGETAAVLQSGYGSDNTFQLAIENGRYVSPNAGYYLTANYRETSGQRDNSDLKHYDTSVNLIWDKTEVLELSLYGEYLDREYGVPGPVTPAGTGDYYINGVKFYNSESANLVNRGRDEDYRTTLEIRSKTSEQLNLRLKADYSVMENYYFQRSYWTGKGDETYVTNTVSGIEGNMVLSPLDRLDLIIGSEYRDFGYENDLQTLDNTGVPVAGGRRISKNKAYTHGTFGELRLRPTNYLSLSAGLRYEEHANFGHEDVARYGMVITPRQGTVLKLNHGEHFKAPTMNDLFWPDDGFQIGNTALKPESGRHTDFTMEQNLFADKLFAAISYFKWNIDDKIDWAEDPSQPTAFPGVNYWTPSNISTYRATGWELSAKAGPYYSMIMDFSFTVLDAVEEKTSGIGRPALYAPTRQLKCGLSHFSDSGLTTAVTARYVSDRPGYYVNDNALNPQVVLDSYWTFDLKLDQVFQSNWHLTLEATNLFDTEYDTYQAQFTDQNTFVSSRQPYPGAGRSLFLALAYRY